MKERGKENGSYRESVPRPGNSSSSSAVFDYRAVPCAVPARALVGPTGGATVQEKKTT